MRKSCVVLLLVAACASGPSAHKLNVGVTEWRRGPSMVAGSHMFHVYVKNEGSETITVRSIHADIAGVNSIDIENATQDFNEQVAPGETGRFDMFVTVMNDRTARDRGELNASINALRLVISADSPSTGNFIETGDYQINVERGDFL